VRQRVRRRLHKRIREHHRLAHSSLLAMVSRDKRAGDRIEIVLHDIAIDANIHSYTRALAAELLVGVGDHRATTSLLRQFFMQERYDDLVETALTLGDTGDLLVSQPMIDALRDSNPDRRRAAARVLGWLHVPGLAATMQRNSAARALSNVLTDRNQPREVREEAAESLAYLSSVPAIPALIAVLDDPDVRIRFWAVFALGSIRDWRTGLQLDPRVVPALELMLEDNDAPPDNWWAVRLEALAMLGRMTPPAKDYRSRLHEEVGRVRQNPAASKQEIAWAHDYDDRDTDKPV
jgi:HEAT repeat protein